MILHRSSEKVRYDGDVTYKNRYIMREKQEDPRKMSQSVPDLIFRKHLVPLDLPVPCFEIDENIVGAPPKVEVTIENLNDNVDAQFLEKMVAKFGAVKKKEVYRHPETDKHLGVARLVFQRIRSADECVKYLHGKSVMGKTLRCYFDPFGKSCKQVVGCLKRENGEQDHAIKSSPIISPVSDTKYKIETIISYENTELQNSCEDKHSINKCHVNARHATSSEYTNRRIPQNVHSTKSRTSRPHNYGTQHDSCYTNNRNMKQVYWESTRNSSEDRERNSRNERSSSKTR